MNRDIVVKTIQLGSAKEAEESHLADLYLDGLGLSVPTGPAGQAYRNAPRPNAQALEQHLGSLTPEYVWLIEALMYCGREDSTDLASMLKQVKETSATKARAIRNLMEKKPLPTYLEKGLALVGDSVLLLYP